MPETAPRRPTPRPSDALLVEPIDAPTFVEPIDEGVTDALPLTVNDLPAVVPARRKPISLGAVLWLPFAVAIWLIGTVSLIVGLAVLSATPVLQFLSLGYLLECSGRMARTGRFRDGFIGQRRAALIGAVVLGAWLVSLPVRFVASMATSAEIIDPGSGITRGWQAGQVIATVLAALFVVGVVAGGFLVVSLVRGRLVGYAATRDALWDFVVGLRLPYYFWLGLRGFVGGLAWIAGPVTLLAVGRAFPPAGFLGALLLAWVVLYVPFLQARFAAENRFRALFELGAVRQQFKRAPLAFAVSFFFTLLLALPLYLLKIELIPREAAWLETLVFIVFMWPARMLVGWAYMRSVKREAPRHWLWRWVGRLSMVPVVLVYLLFVFLSQYTSWYGIWSLYEQHAFLLPVPFLSM